MYTIIIAMVILTIMFLVYEFKQEDPTIIGCILCGIFFGACLGSLVRLMLPMNLVEVTTEYNIKPIDDIHSIGYDVKNNCYIVNTIDNQTGIITNNNYYDGNVKIRYNNNYKVKIVKYKASSSLINKFAYDIKYNQVKEIILEVPNESISLNYKMIRELQ